MRIVKTSGSRYESEQTECSIAAFLDEGARLYSTIWAPLWSRLPLHGASKTPTTPIRVADLAAAGDGTIETLRRRWGQLK